MQDEAFHEIQLNGKQLVFLFMAATVVSVVIFLCGVMVGRGVPTQRAADQLAVADEASLDPTALAPAPPVPASSDGASAASAETLTYPGRLEDSNPPVETLKTPEAARAAREAARAEAALPQPAAEPDPLPTPVKTPGVALASARPAPSAAPAPKPAAPAPAVVAAVAAPAAARGPAGNGFVVQVAAVNKRAEADAIAKGLVAKGYPAFVTTPAGAANVFRVRVGKYSDRREADAVAARLEKEEQFKPWITR